MNKFIHNTISDLLSLSFLVMLIGLMLSESALAQTVSASMDRHQVTEGESFTLIITITGTNQTYSPNLTPLDDNFYVLSTSSQTQMQIVNGKTSQSLSLYITLEPKRTGMLEIPPLTIGTEQTRALNINVLPRGADARAPAKDVFIELDVLPLAGETVYVQSQISVVIKLFYSGEVSEGSLSEPDPDNAYIERLEELTYTSRRGGENYNVLERRYAVIPERSGELIIPPVRFDGRMGGGRSRFFSSRNRGQRISARSEQTVYTVQGIPAAFPATDWLPARSLNIRVDAVPSEVRVGEPVTRTIIVEADGITHTNLPELPVQELPGARVYPNQGQGETGRDGRWLLAKQEYQQAIVASREGLLSLPEQTIHWWDVVADKAKTAVIPAVQIEVLPALGATTGTDHQAVADSSNIADGTTADTRAQTVAKIVPVRDPGFWRWLTFLFAALWILTLILWGWPLARSRWFKAAVTDDQQPMPSFKASLKKLRKACENHQAEAAASALLQWAKVRWPRQAPINLRDVGERLGSATAQSAIEQLEIALYSRNKDAWRGDGLWQAIHLAGKARQSAVMDQQKGEVLPELYPD